MDDWLGIERWWDETDRGRKPVLNNIIISETNPEWIGLESNLGCGG
jgi:hypothetical protein